VQATITIIAVTTKNNDRFIKAFEAYKKTPAKIDMRILLIQSHLGRIKYSPPLYPIGLSYVAAALTKHTVKIIDLNMWELPLAYQMLEKKISEFKPDVAGISIRNIDTTYRFDVFYHFKTIRPTAQLIKKNNPDIKLMVGGSGFSLFAQKIMERVPEFDFGIYLEGEQSSTELLDNLDSPETVKGIFIRKNGTVQFTGPRQMQDFDSVATPKRDSDIIDIKGYIGLRHDNIGIQSKRGCMLSCSYCSYPFLTGKDIRLRSPKKVVDEIEYLISLGVRRFSFVDNIFNVPVQHAKAICEEIIKRGLDVEWGAWFEIKNTTEEIMTIAKRAGCKHFGFSPDGATNKALSILRKDITEKDIMENLKLVRKIKGIKAGYNFFCMLPGTNLYDLAKTLLLYLKIPLILFSKGGGVGLGWIRIEPYTHIHELALKEGFLSKDTDLLPKDEKELKKLFYSKSSYKYIDLLILNLVKFMEGIVKPSVKFLLRIPHLRRK
jgi:hypothetical protein